MNLRFLDGVKRKDRKEDLEEEPDTDSDSELDIETTNFAENSELGKETEKNPSLVINPFLPQATWQIQSANLHTLLNTKEENNYSSSLAFSASVIQNTLNNVVMK